jgi:pyruvate/2-oxoglutarate dehydrogenase complex dihydrolipoamide acyltransferase (E2) component
MHYPIGVFLVAYGLTGFGTGLLGWDDRREELADYVGAGVTTPALAVVKAIELGLVALTLAGLVRRRDVWFLPALAGWLAGFGVFTLLDIFKGKWGVLVEHLVFLGVFALLLFLSYGLSVKARVGRAAAQPASPAQAQPAPAEPAPAQPEAPAPAGGPPPGPAGNLSRTQEFALQALNRLQQRVTPALGAVLPQAQRQRPQAQAPQAQAPQAQPQQAQAPQARPHVPAPSPSSESESAPSPAPQTVVDDGYSEATGEDVSMTVQTPLPAQRPAPPDATKPLPLPDPPDQQQ